MKVKIVLDADVIIHFSKGGLLAILPDIFTNFEYVILSTVYKEIHRPIKDYLDNQILYLKNITLLPFEPKSDMKREYAILVSEFGKGESACMAYCKYTHDVVGSSNLRDIKEYCDEHKMTYLTTIDFLYYAIKKNVITVARANKFIKEVKAKDSKLPDINFDTYVSPTEMI